MNLIHVVINKSVNRMMFLEIFNKMNLKFKINIKVSIKNWLIKNKICFKINYSNKIIQSNLFYNQIKMLILMLMWIKIYNINKNKFSLYNNPKQLILN